MLQLMNLWMGDGGERCKEIFYKSNPALCKSSPIQSKYHFSDAFSEYASLSDGLTVASLLLATTLGTHQLHTGGADTSNDAADLLALLFSGVYCPVRKHGKMNLFGKSFRFLA